MTDFLAYLAHNWLQIFIVLFAMAVAFAGYVQIQAREGFNAGVAFTVAAYLAFVAYYAG